MNHFYAPNLRSCIIHDAHAIDEEFTFKILERYSIKFYIKYPISSSMYGIFL